MELYFIIIGIVLLILIIWYISTFNKIKTANIKVEEAISGIDVALTKRYDVITQMVEVVKGYAKHEQETLTKLIEIRKGMPISEKNEANKIMSDNLHKINLLAESYPELKASENFKTLQKAIMDVEEHLQAARRCYNSNVTNFNELIITFPASIVANKMKMVKKDFFEIEESKKENVDIKI